MISDKDDFIKKLLKCNTILRTDYKLDNFLLLIDDFFMDETEITIYIRTNDTNVPVKYDPFGDVINKIFDIHIHRTYLYQIITYPNTKLCCDNNILTSSIPSEWNSDEPV